MKRSDAGTKSGVVSRRGFLTQSAAGGAGSLMMMQARGRRGQHRPPSRGAIDVHAHFFPERFLRTVSENPASGITVDFSDRSGPAMLNRRSGARVPLDVSYWDLDKRRKRMDEQGVTLHALSLTSPMVHWAPPELGAELARIVNDSMSEAHTAFPGRFVGCAALPVQNTDLALKELNRVAAMRGIRGVYLPTSVGDRDLSDPAFAPIFERCEAIGLPVLLHPVTVIGAQRLEPYYLGNLLGNLFDTTVAATKLVLSGTMDRFPKLQVVLPHAGGTLPYVAGRLEHGQEVRPEAKDKARPFSNYLRRFYYDTITHSPEILQFLVTSVGADRVMLGSDYCFDMGYEHPRDIVGQIRLSPADRELVFSTNAAGIFRL